ncbi:MAG TPA: hypothetical protein VGG74_21065 [Kofleriaceae bacterium]|jgi:hypothetical protein
MTEHVHEWVADRARNRYACACGVVGHKPALMSGQMRTASEGVIAYVCRKKVDGHHCGEEAVHVTGDRQASRCRDHAPAKSATKAA